MFDKTIHVPPKLTLLFAGLFLLFSLCPFMVCAQSQASCPTGQVKCSNGCVNIATDTKNCGTCGRVCAAGQTCSQGTCVGASVKGKRIDLKVENKNCGRCGENCAAGLTCIYVNSVCFVSCQ
jgi:hypothetical protein